MYVEQEQNLAQSHFVLDFISSGYLAHAKRTCPEGGNVMDHETPLARS